MTWQSASAIEQLELHAPSKVATHGRRRDPDLVLRIDELPGRCCRWLFAGDCGGAHSSAKFVNSTPVYGLPAAGVYTVRQQYVPTLLVASPDAASDVGGCESLVSWRGRIVVERLCRSDLVSVALVAPDVGRDFGPGRRGRT